MAAIIRHDYHCECPWAYGPANHQVVQEEHKNEDSKGVRWNLTTADWCLDRAMVIFQPNEDSKEVSS